MNLNDKINRSRPGHPPAPDLVRHARRCVICHHPERNAIEEAFVHWFHADRIVDDHNLPSRSALYRHAYATGLYDLRRQNMRYALEHLIEDAIHAPVSGDCVIRAIRAHARLTADGRWIDPPQQIIVERRDADDPLVTSHSSLATGFLTGTPKQLETAATDTKQTIEAPSNRDTNTAIETGDHESEGEPSRPILFADVPRRRRIGRFLIETPERLEMAATDTKQTIEVLSNRGKIAPPSEAN